MKTGTKPTVAAAKKSLPVMTKQERVVQQLLTILGDTGVMRLIASQYSELLADVCRAFPVAAKAVITGEDKVPVTRTDIDVYVEERMKYTLEQEAAARERIRQAQLEYQGWLDLAHKLPSLKDLDY